MNAVAASGIFTGVPFSWNPVDDLQVLFQFEFMRNAYAAGTAAAIAAGIVGYFVVLRSLSFGAHTLSQIGFAGATGALAAGVNPLFGLLVINGAGAAVIGILGRHERGRDVVVGVVLTAGLGLGLLFLAFSQAQEAVPVLVGDVLGISFAKVIVTVAAVLAVVTALALMYRPLLFSTLDDEIAEARGVPIGWVSVLLLFILAVTVSVATPIAGILLTYALIVGPAAAAALLSANPLRAVSLSVVLSVAYLWISLALSYWVDFPPSVYVAALSLAGYLTARAVHSKVHTRLTVATAPPV